MADTPATPEPVFIGNAGLVLLSPFLPHLFQELDLLTPENKDTTLSRAVHLLQYMATGQPDAPDPSLALNKLLCGSGPETTISAGTIEMTEPEQAVCDQLLKSVLSRWPALSNGTSIAGLQQTFLQRAGRLKRQDEAWLLRVERKTLDILLEQMPWSFQTIKHSWMPQILHVEW